MIRLVSSHMIFMSICVMVIIRSRRPIIIRSHFLFALFDIRRKNFHIVYQATTPEEEEFFLAQLLQRDIKPDKANKFCEYWEQHKACAPGASGLEDGLELVNVRAPSIHF
jgi:hypothetical protein